MAPTLPDGQDSRLGLITIGAWPDEERDKKAVMADVAAAERATGYVAGGISPLGQRRRLPVVIDSSALGFATIFCSGGRRGLEIELAPADLVRAAGARVAAIAQPAA
jgi:Cys-tRNA(Pro)/Cys-tRNA(Cys) deacylase